MEIFAKLFCQSFALCPCNDEIQYNDEILLQVTVLKYQNYHLQYPYVRFQ